MTHMDRQVMAQGAAWQAPLLLDPATSRLTHAAHGTTGRYTEAGDCLIVEWDRFAPEVFVRTDGVYRSVFSAETAAVGLLRPLAARDPSLPIASTCLRLQAGGLVHVRPGTSDIPVFHAIFTAGEYQPLAGMLEVRTIIDLGANTGLSAAWFAHAHPNARIIAVEPEAENFRMLRLNCLDRPQIEPVRAAIWSHDTECELDVSENGIQRDAWAHRSRSVGMGGERVSALSLPSLLDRFGIESVDILKVDVEGAEIELFSAGAEEWLGKVRCLVVETHERFRPGADALVTQALATTHEEVPGHSEDRIFLRRDEPQGPAPSVAPISEPACPPVHLYQIAWSLETLATIEPGYHVLDNLTNERPDWYEYWPIRHFLLREALDEAAFYGFFSPKFSHKTQLTHADVTGFVRANADRADVLLFSPQPDMGAFFLNVFEQAELCDPGAIDAYEAFLAETGQILDLRGLLMDSRHIVFSNYFVARPAFWRAWLAFNEAVFAVCEGPDTPLRQALCASTAYPGAVQRKVFLQERTASLLLATGAHWRSVACNPFAMAWSSWRFREHPQDAAISDALKIALRDQGFPQYLDAYAGVRERFRSSGLMPT